METTLTIPKTNEDLMRGWRTFIAKNLKSRNHIRWNFEDVLQEVCLKLITSDLVQKFWAGVSERSHPLTVTAPEAAKMLGVKLGDFIEFQIKQTADALVPVNGKGHPIPGGLGYSSPTALYLFAEVIVLGASVTFENQGVQQLPPPKDPTVAQFRAYLEMAIHNHVSNICRTHTRKASKEHLPDHFAEFRTEEGFAFEALIPDNTAEADMDDRVEAALLLREAPGLVTKKSAKEGKSFFELLENGYSIREATKACKLTRHEIRVITARIGEG